MRPPTRPKIDEWWTANPDANIGIAVPPGIVVVDVDPRNGGDSTFSELGRRYGDFPATLTALTGGGGWHYWYRTNGKPVPTSLGPGIDVKHGGTGYAVAPPSIHPTGDAYEWDGDWTDPPAELPECVYDLAEPAEERPPHHEFYDDPRLQDLDTPGRDFNAQRRRAAVPGRSRLAHWPTGPEHR